MLTYAAVLAAAPQFPALSGRVADEAGILSPAFESEIATQLAAHEQATTNQVVVTTLKSLQGYDIADYSNQLFRQWGIGQKDKNNGVLLVVALNDRKMRIEVGYGLEGVLTDAISRDIIERHIKPPFRQQQFEQGIREGVTAILAALNSEYHVANPPFSAVPLHTRDHGSLGKFFFVIFFVFIALMIMSRRRLAKSPTRLIPAVTAGGVIGIFVWILTGLFVIAVVLTTIVFLLTLFSDGSSGRGGSGGSWDSGSGWGSSSGGGGFSGGGGSSGGGGASGNW